MTSKPDHMKYKEGTKRSFRPNEWYVNKKAEGEANRYFTGQKGGVPNNPQNFQSFMPVAAPVNPALSNTVSSKNVIATKTPFKHVTALVPVTNIEPA